MRADPASQGFGITNAPGAWCNARKRMALSFWLTVIGFLRVVIPRSILPLDPTGEREPWPNAR